MSTPFCPEIVMHEKAFVNHKNFDIEIGGNLLMTCFSRCENGRKKLPPE